MAIKRCCLCQKQKPADDFHRNTRRKDGRQDHCKSCNALHTKMRKYGITAEEYARLLEKQHGVCAICKKPEPASGGLCIDHDHATGEVRGLLCHNCNLGVGRFFDSPLLMIAGADYLLAATTPAFAGKEEQQDATRDHPAAVRPA